MAAMAGEGTVDSDSSDLAKGEEHKIVPWRAFQKLFAHEPQGWSSMIGYRAPSYDSSHLEKLSKSRKLFRQPTSTTL
jgi:hypothetical protein